MPYKAEVRIKSRQLQANDELKLGDQPSDGTAEVQSVSVGTKWTKVTLIDEELGTWSLKYGVDDDVVVMRPQQTLAEKEALTLKYSIQAIRHMIDEAGPALEKARKELTDSIPADPTWSYRYYENYVEARTVATIWDNVVAIAEYESMNLRDATLKMKAEIINDLVEARHTSRSTSLMSNAVDSIVLQAKSDWVATLGYRVR
jgi:hypothetical protein